MLQEPWVIRAILGLEHGSSNAPPKVLIFLLQRGGGVWWVENNETVSTVTLKWQVCSATKLLVLMAFKWSVVVIPECWGEGREGRGGEGRGGEGEGRIVFTISIIKPSHILVVPRPSVFLTVGSLLVCWCILLQTRRPLHP